MILDDLIGNCLRTFTAEVSTSISLLSSSVAVVSLAEISSAEISSAEAPEDTESVEVSSGGEASTEASAGEASTEVSSRGEASAEVSSRGEASAEAVSVDAVASVRASSLPETVSSV